MFVNKENDPHKKLSITTLHSAVKCGRVEQIKNSLERYGLPKNATKTTDYLIMKLAIDKNQVAIAKLLINANCNVNMQNDDEPNNTPLGIAIRKENEELTALLLQKKATLGSNNPTKVSVLHLAVQQRSLKMIQFLLRCQIDINQLSNGKTALHLFFENCYAMHEQKNIDIIKLFLDNGASTNFKVSGKTLLHCVVSTKEIDIIRRVLQTTNNVNEQTTHKDTALHILFKEQTTEETLVDIIKMFLSKGAKINIQNSTGDTAFHLAVKSKYLKVWQMFLPCQWDVNCCNQQGNTVLHLILQNSSNFFIHEEYYQIIKHILKMCSLKLNGNSQNETPLYIAASNRQNRVINDLLMLSVDINATDKNGCNALYMYMKYFIDNNIVPDPGDIDIVKKMVSIGADPSAICCNTKYSPMHFALQLKNKEIILLMLKSSFDFNKFQAAQGKSILHWLSSGKADFTETEDLDMAKVAEICIKKGAKVDQLDSDSKTPLYWAVLMRRKHMVQTLLEYGADPNVCDREGGTILENLMQKKACVFTLSLSSSYTIYHHYCGTFIQAREKEQQLPSNIERDSEIAQMLLFKKVIAEKVSNGNVSIFHYCARDGHLDMLLKIIPYCKDANIRDSSKNTILHTLLAYNLNITKEVEKKVAEIVAILLVKGAEVRATNEKDEIPLHLAASGRHLKTCNILLQSNKFSVEDLDSNGNSMLHFLCMLPVGTTNDLIENSLSELFIGRGLDVNARNKQGMTPVLFAAASGSINLMKILAKHGATMNCVDGVNLDMPIHLAAQHNCQDVVEYLLLQYGVDVNVRRKDRKTALHLSVAHKLPKVTGLLLENGADTDLRDVNGKTPLHWACWHESLDNINELLDYGADVNVEDNFGKTPLMYTSRTNDIWTKLHYHVIKLKTANMPVSESNNSYISQYTRETNYVNSAELRQFESAAVEETLQMEKVSIAVRTALADVLQMTANKLSVFKCNEDFQKFLYASDFKEKYPFYADLVRACYRKGIIRSDLMLSAKDAFRKILGLALPDTCCDAIFYYLDNENLHNLEKSAKIRVTKRKRFFDEINDVVPSKRVRRISV